MSSNSSEIQACLDRLAHGDPLARETLVQLAQERLLRLASRMLRNYPGVRRWEETDDIYQNSLVRLYSALQSVKPTTTESFLRLAAVQIRRELIDLSRHYYGPQGLGTHYRSGQNTSDGCIPAPAMAGADTHDPGRLVLWTEFHTQVESLPDDDRKLYDLLWYQGLSQAETAGILKVSERTVQRRWQQLRIQMHDFLGEGFAWNN